MLPLCLQSWDSNPGRQIQDGFFTNIECVDYLRQIEQEYTVTNKLTTNYKKHICKRIDTETHFKVFDKYYKIKDGAKIEAEENPTPPP